MKVVPMSALPKKYDRIFSKSHGWDSWRNSRALVMINTQTGILLANFFEGKKKNTIRIQKIS
jgi:hypothetical protein